MAEQSLLPEQANAVNVILEIMAAAPVPLAVHNAGRKALADLVQALLPAAVPAEPPVTKPELVP